MKQVLFTLLLLLSHAAAFTQIERIEPPFWWSDMKHADVQLMVYGKDIAQWEVESASLEISEVTKTENPNYLFVTVATQDKPPGKYELSFRRKGKKTFRHDFELKQRREGSSKREGFNSSDAIYLIMPDRFANGDPSNDSVKGLEEGANRSLPGGRHGGDIEGIIQHLDYIKDLGMSAIWSTPLCEDNDKAYSYHTYAQSDVYKIDPRYGTNEDYRRLADELHQRDMKLIMDYVTNHWGLEHWMIQDLPAYDWIHQFPGYAQTNYRMTTQMDPNASERDARYCMDGWFVKSMPDLNQNNPLTLRYLIQNAIWWIEYADLDGFRVDTYSYADKEGIADWTKAIMDEYPNFNIVGEVWMHDQAQMAYWQRNSAIGALQNYNSHLPSVMDFTLHDALMEAFKADPSWNKGLVQIYENFVNDFLYPDIDNLLVFAENHDTERINQLYQNPAHYKQIMTLIATIRGIPQVYYGSEIGMKGEKSKGDGDIRRDFPGGWKGDPVNAFTAEGRTPTMTTYHDITSKLFTWRKDAEVIHKGKTVHFIPENEVYVYFRILEGETVMVVINNNKESKRLSVERFAEVLNGFTRGTDVFSNRTFALENLTIDAQDALILELQTDNK